MALNGPNLLKMVPDFTLLQGFTQLNLIPGDVLERSKMAVPTQ